MLEPNFFRTLLCLTRLTDFLRIRKQEKQVRKYVLAIYNNSGAVFYTYVADQKR